MVDRNLLENKIKQEYPNVTHQGNISGFANAIIENYVEELEPNIIEWIEDKPFSDIFIDGVSLNMLKEAWGNSFEFMEALRCMYGYKKFGSKKPYVIMNRFIAV